VVEMIEQTLQRQESQSSYEFGPANRRHKIYYWEVKDLVAKLNQLRDRGRIGEENGGKNGKIEG